MKFDKDKLLKHHFWILLGVALPLAIVGIFILSTSVPANIEANRKTIESKLDAIKKKQQAAIKTPSLIELKRKQVDELQARKDVLWKAAYEEQKDLFTWPQSFERRFHFKDGLFPLEIKVTRAKEAPKSPEAGKDAAPDKAATKGDKTAVAASKDAPKIEIAPDLPNHITGVITRSDDESFDVRDKAGASHTIYRTPKPNIKIAEEPTKSSFADLREGDAVDVLYYQSRYFYDRLTPAEIIAYARSTSGNGLTPYKSQIDPIISQVHPVNTEGEGIVQLGTWPYQKGSLPPAGSFLNYVATDWDENIDFTEDAWIAQEDLWIQDELYRVINQANEYVSKFEGQWGKYQKGMEYTFSNPNYELKISASPTGELTATAKNLLHRRQKLDLDLMIRFSEKYAPEKVTLGGEPLEPDEIRPNIGVVSNKSAVKFNTSTRDGIYGVEQVLNWETAAIKRIDQIGIAGGALTKASPRLQGVELKPYSAPDAPATAPAPAPVPAAGKDQPGTVQAVPAGGMFARARYLPNNKDDKEARRLPVVINLIIDPDHLNRVLNSFANSKLRFLVTDAVWNRYPGSLRPLALAGSASVASSDLEANVSLVIHGIITIYERNPTKPSAGPAS